MIFINRIKDFCEFLAEANREPDEIAAFLCLHTLRELEPATLWIGQLAHNKSLKYVGGFGFETDEIKNWLDIPVITKLPITDALKRESVITIETKKKAFTRYPGMVEADFVTNEWKGTIAFPLRRSGAAVLLVNNCPVKSDMDDDFFLTVGSILALYLRRNSDVLNKLVYAVGRNGSNANQGALTTRQSVILEYLVKGKTNAEIARDLGYSESLIRQETVEIYRLMNVTGRRQLMEIKANSVIV